MRRNTYPSRFARVHFPPKRFNITEKRFSTFNKSRLSWIRLGVVTRSRISNAQERNAQSDVARRANHFLRQQIRIVVSLSVRRVMKVMKLADGRDAAQSHFEKRHARSIVNIFRR